MTRRETYWTTKIKQLLWQINNDSTYGNYINDVGNDSPNAYKTQLNLTYVAK